MNVHRTDVSWCREIDIVRSDHPMTLSNAQVRRTLESRSAVPLRIRYPRFTAHAFACCLNTFNMSVRSLLSVRSFCSY